MVDGYGLTTHHFDDFYAGVCGNFGGPIHAGCPFLGRPWPINLLCLL